MLNLFDTNIPKIGEQFDTLLEHKNIKIVRIVSSDTLESELYCQDEDEWVVVIEGSATIEIEKQTQPLHKGDSLFIPANTAHRVLQTQHGTIWLAVHVF
jgi:cupin 2 domain-containing protein